MTTHDQHQPPTVHPSTGMASPARARKTRTNKQSCPWPRARQGGPVASLLSAAPNVPPSLPRFFAPLENYRSLDLDRELRPVDVVITLVWQNKPTLFALLLLTKVVYLLQAGGEQETRGLVYPSSRRSHPPKPTTPPLVVDAAARHCHSQHRATTPPQPSLHTALPSCRTQERTRMIVASVRPACASHEQPAAAACPHTKIHVNSAHTPLATRNQAAGRTTAEAGPRTTQGHHVPQGTTHDDTRDTSTRREDENKARRPRTILLEGGGSLLPHGTVEVARLMTFLPIICL